MHGHFLERVDSCGRNVISYFIYSSKETSPHHGIHAHLNVKLLIMQCKMLMLSRRFSGLQMKKDTCSLEDPQGTDVSGCQLIAMPGEAFLA